eukprot:TRINITY_DN15324_c0_g1_i1.p1 TRINITY_DN15324_c0_g1~~TRINITY_DN15324_c0_g1_i1.p1  ORF type:complete len:486 (+),score=55.74 TRINITY_DN15324_c0_g1_i1:111-1568(+)
MVESSIRRLFVVVCTAAYLLAAGATNKFAIAEKVKLDGAAWENLIANLAGSHSLVNSPQPRTGACIWRDSASETVWMYGGYATVPIDSTSRYLNDLYSWDLKTKTWQLLNPIQHEGAEKTAKSWPPAVADAACWFVQSTREFYFYEDEAFWKFSLESRTWTNIGEATKIESAPTDPISSPGSIISARLSWIDTANQILYFFGGNIVSEGKKPIESYNTWSYALGSRAGNSWTLASKGSKETSPQKFDDSCSLTVDDEARRVRYNCENDPFEWIYQYEGSLAHQWTKIQKRRAQAELASTPNTAPHFPPFGSGPPEQGLLLPIGAIAGIAVASILTVLLTAIVFIVCYQDRAAAASNPNSSAGSDFNSRSATGRSWKRSRNTSGYTSENKVSINSSKPSTASIDSSAASDSVSAFDRSDDEGDIESSIMTDTTATTDGSNGPRKHKVSYISRLTPSPRKTLPSLRASKDSKVADDESGSASLSDTD